METPESPRRDEEKNPQTFDPDFPVTAKPLPFQLGRSTAPRPDLRVVKQDSSPTVPSIAPGQFRPIHVRQLYAETPKTREWTWDGMLARGSLAALVAYMKVGKSTFVSPLVRAVARGVPFLGRATRQGAVLILAVEEDPIEVRLRLEEFGITDRDPVYIHRATLVPSPENLVAIAAFIKTHGVVLVVLDTVGHCWDVNNENDNTQVLRALKPWLDLARETRATVLLIHHEGKGDLEGHRHQGAKAPRGASSFGGIVDQILTLTPVGRKKELERQRALESAGRYKESPRRLTVELTGDGHDYVLVEDLEASPALTANQEKVLAFLRAQPDHKPRAGPSWTERGFRRVPASMSSRPSRRKTT